MVPDAEMFSAPGDALAEFEEAGRAAFGGHGLFAGMDVTGEVHFHAAGEVEAAVDGCADDREIVEGGHEETISINCSAVFRSGRMSGSAETRSRNTTLFVDSSSRRAVRACLGDSSMTQKKKTPI